MEGMWHVDSIVRVGGKTVGTYDRSFIDLTVCAFTGVCLSGAKCFVLHMVPSHLLLLKASLRANILLPIGVPYDRPFSDLFTMPFPFIAIAQMKSCHVYVVRP